MQTHLVQSHYVQRTPSDSTRSDPQHVFNPTACARPTPRTDTREMREVKFAKFSTMIEESASSKRPKKALQKTLLQSFPGSEILECPNSVFPPMAERVLNSCRVKIVPTSSLGSGLHMRPCIGEISVSPKRGIPRGTAADLIIPPPGASYVGHLPPSLN